MPAPTFITIGHVTTDVIDGTPVCGGAALYSGVQARLLGCEVRVLTSAPPAHAALALLHGCDVHLVPSPRATTFVYAQVRGERRVALKQTAATLPAAALPASFTDSAILLLCPVFHELAPGFFEEPAAAGLAPRVVGVAPQGWLRRCGAGQEVERLANDLPASLVSRATALFISEHDVDDAEALAQRWLSGGARAVVVTRGARGATIFTDAARSEVPATPAREIDPTGAGDVFATAYLVATYEGAAPIDAARFAAAAAACSVEGPSVCAIAARDVIERRNLARSPDDELATLD